MPPVDAVNWRIVRRSEDTCVWSAEMDKLAGLRALRRVSYCDNPECDDPDTCARNHVQSLSGYPGLLERLATGLDQCASAPCDIVFGFVCAEAALAQGLHPNFDMH